MGAKVEIVTEVYQWTEPAALDYFQYQQLKGKQREDCHYDPGSEVPTLVEQHRYSIYASVLLPLCLLITLPSGGKKTGNALFDTLGAVAFFVAAPLTLWFVFRGIGFWMRTAGSYASYSAKKRAWLRKHANIVQLSDSYEEYCSLAYGS